MEKGFTMIEAVVSIAIVSIGILCVATMQSTSALGNSRSFLISSATVLAEDTIEAMIARDFDEIQDSHATRKIRGVDFSVNATVGDDAPMQDCKEIQCDVAWNNKGRAASMRFVYVCPRTR
jgi:prepilin-type N-terminal cleavage/methylation domain-containing protein